MSLKVSRSFTVLCVMLIIALGGVLAWVYTKPVPEPEPVPKFLVPVLTDYPKIIAYGDSLTSGYEYPKSKSYPHLLNERLKQQGCKYEVLNYGLSGDTTDAAMRRLNDALSVEKADIFILELGANDMMMKGASPEKIAENLRSIISQAREKGMRVMLCGYHPKKKIDRDYQDRIDAMYAGLAEEFSIPLMKDFMQDVSGPGSMTDDQVHPSEEGIRMLEASVYKNLKPMLDCPEPPGNKSATFPKGRRN